jgi:hypothetical protein
LNSRINNLPLFNTSFFKLLNFTLYLFTWNSYYTWNICSKCRICLKLCNCSFCKFLYFSIFRDLFCWFYRFSFSNYSTFWFCRIWCWFLLNLRCRLFDLRDILCLFLFALFAVFFLLLLRWLDLDFRFFSFFLTLSRFRNLK